MREKRGKIATRWRCSFWFGSGLSGPLEGGDGRPLAGLVHALAGSRTYTVPGLQARAGVGRAWAAQQATQGDKQKDTNVLDSPQRLNHNATNAAAAATAVFCRPSWAGRGLSASAGTGRS